MNQQFRARRPLYVPLCLIACLMFGAMSTPAHANDVDATLQGGVLEIGGDNADNNIVIEQPPSSDFVVVRGQNGTTVNGLEFVPFDFDEVNALDIRMKGGADFVRLSGLTINSDVFVDLGRGDDRIRSTNNPCSIGGNLTIIGGSGLEIIRLINWVVGQDLAMDGKASAMDILLQHSDFGNVDIVGGSAIDFVTIFDCDVANWTTLETKGANDQVIVSHFVGASLFVDTNRGVDTVDFSDVMTSGDIGVFTGNQVDLVEFTSISSGTILVSLDRGDDAFVGNMVAADISAVFDGGRGFDTFVDQGDVAGDIVNFEAMFP